MTSKRIPLGVLRLAFITINDSSVLLTLVLVLFIDMCIYLFEIVHRHVYERRPSIQCSISYTQINDMRAILCLTEVQLPPNRISWPDVKPTKVKFCLIKIISIKWTEFDSWLILIFINWEGDSKCSIFNQALWYFMMKNLTWFLSSRIND